MFVEEDWGFSAGQLQDFEDEDQAASKRRAKIKQLRTQVQVLQGRLEARDAIIRAQQAKILRLQQMLAKQSRIVVIGQRAEA